MTKIKICGLQTVADAQAVQAAGADWAGVILAPSRRQVTVAQAQQIRAALSPHQPLIGVFVNAPVPKILSLFTAGVIQIAQLHGQEQEEEVQQLQAAGMPVIQVVQPAQRYLPTAARWQMVDSSAGHGTAFRWAQYAYRCFLAGGLTLANLTAAIQTVHPWAVDLSSGVETAGHKDPAKIKAVVQLAHQLM